MWNNKKQQKSVSLMSNLQTYYHFKLDFQKVDQHTGGKWLIHGTKCRKDNQLQSYDVYQMLARDIALFVPTKSRRKKYMYKHGKGY